MLPLTGDKEFIAFDKLPKTLRTILNYSPTRLDPRFIFGMYKTQGLKSTIQYLEDIGLTTSSLDG